MASSDNGDSGSSYAGPPRMQQQRDNASNYVAASFAALRSLPTRPIVDDEHWHSDSPQDFHRGFATGQYYFPGEPRTIPRKSVAPASSSGSMAVAINQSQYSSSYYGTPSLAGSYATTASSGPSARTGSGGSFLSRYQAAQRLEEGDDGVPQVPAATATWQCPFGFLRCNEALDNIQEWDAHCQYHFRGMDNLPKNVQCPFDCPWSYQGATGQEAWRQRWAHLWNSHSGGGRINPLKRPDPSLVEHLWRIGVISSAEKKELRTNGFLSDTVYLESASSSRDRRNERRQGGSRNPRDSGSASGYSVVRR